jgi:hypothetical protein
MDAVEVRLHNYQTALDQAQQYLASPLAVRWAFGS